MNDNYLRKYLNIKVYQDKTVVEYCNDNNICFIHEYKLGLDKIKKELASEIIMSNWVNGVIYTLENISLEDRVPTFIYLSAENFEESFKKVLKNKSTYSQFYLEPSDRGKGVHVIINKINYGNINSHLESYLSSKGSEDNIIITKDNKENSKSYERYTKAISQFKV